VSYYLGVDVGGTKTQAAIVAETGKLLGIGFSGCGNHEIVGYDGFCHALEESCNQALSQANLIQDQISKMALGISGLDWLSQVNDHVEAIRRCGWKIPFRMENDSLIGLLAGSNNGWGVGIIAGTGSNCIGIKPDLLRIGRVTGAGPLMGEDAGGGDLVRYAIQAIAKSWCKRTEPTLLSNLFMEKYNFGDFGELIEAWSTQRLLPDPKDAPLVFQAAEAGDQQAINIINHATDTLADMVKGVVNQLNFEDIGFELVLIGSLFKQERWMVNPLKRKVLCFAKKAKLIYLKHPPVIGAVLLAMPPENELARLRFRADFPISGYS